MTTTKHPGNQTTRERILDVAADLIVEQGYAGTPLSVIAGKLDLTKAALYYHFRSKDDILSGIVSPLLDKIDELLADTPQHFPNAEQRWDFIVNYSDVLLSNSRAVAVLATNEGRSWLPAEISTRIVWHRERTAELALLADMTEDEQVRAVLIMDMLHRELVFTEDRVVIPGMSPEHRREIVYRFAREALDS